MTVMMHILNLCKIENDIFLKWRTIITHELTEDSITTNQFKKRWVSD